MITVKSLHISQPVIEKTLSGYRSNLRSLTRGFWNGALNYFEFYEGMWRIIEIFFTQAWIEGMSKEGLTIEDMNSEERVRLTQEVMRERSFINGFATAIEINSKVHKGKLEPLLRRADQWANGYTRMVSLSMTYARRDPKLKWVYGDVKAHCRSCLRLNGKVKRASVWKAADLAPQMWKLECRGIHCRCTLEPTTERATPGPLPAI